MHLKFQNRLKLTYYYMLITSKLKAYFFIYYIVSFFNKPFSNPKLFKFNLFCFATPFYFYLASLNIEHHIKLACFSDNGKCGVTCEMIHLEDRIYK